MIKFIDMTGKTEDEAIRRALEQLGLERDDVSVEILERAKSGFLGIGGSPATVRVSYDDGQPEPKPEPVKPEPKSAAPKAEKKPVYCAEVLQKEVRAREKQEREAKRGERRAEPKAEKAPREPVVLGEEIRDEKSEQIRTFLSGLLEHMDAKAEVKVYEVEKNRYKVILEGEKLGALIGRRGETLDAIQQLTNYSINRGGESKRARVQIDAENYREKREESLERLAQKVAGKVVKYRRNVTLEPMNAYERHVIHTALQDTQYITTFSIGTEPNRRVVVSYDRTKQ
ncbi:MAG: protein jag [Oscillibacter sp.]|jgi:spoIIIJ-associated protein|nr:protein jag [Oscillibacter sp.]MDY5710715.1 RNA-binding cell elongation regulator Jag/EloR [Oscillospiraceae bacterium]MDY5805346.1 RNA-binding cell elongation regulator Jag/EloR [Oscillospiraceae bacterium]CCZ46776.1 jag protein homolog [Firmicutes bacterium CAG:129]